MKSPSIPSEYMVRVQCMTYNHAPYIEDAMNGFCMQKTDFPFVCVIVDDASTDGEPEVIKKYLNNNFDLQNDQFFKEEDTDDYHLTFARHKTNLNCYFGVLLLKYNHWNKKKAKAPYFEEWSKAKYVALCEGDDYWTHPKKLQVQVDYLENHPGYTMVFHRADVLDEMNSGIQFHMNVSENKDYSASDLMRCWIVPTASMVFNKNVLNFKIKKKERFISGDIRIYLSAATMGHVRGMEDVMSVYRIHKDSLSRSDDFYLERLRKAPYQYICIMDNFPNIDKEIVRGHLFSYASRLFDTEKNNRILILTLYLLIKYCPRQSYPFLKERAIHKIKSILLPHPEKAKLWKIV